MKNNSLHLKDCAYIGITFIFGFILQGSIPYAGLTTLGQLVSVIGYPISFLNEGGMTLYAVNMGYPGSAPMSTLLAPSLVMVFFLACGLAAQDAFNFTFLLWYLLGYAGAYGMARRSGIEVGTSALLALLWMSFPIVWNSSGYAHLHFGLVVLPFLFHLSIRCMDTAADGRLRSLWLYPVATLLAVFTDGYAFMFFAVGSSILLVHQAATRRDSMAQFVKVILPLHAASFAAAYAAFSVYIGKSEYASAPLDFFRGWAVDLAFLVRPSQGVHWFWDSIGFSVPRSGESLFGDASVWISSFVLPIALVGAVVYWRARKEFALTGAMAIVALFGLYMAMGPSVKMDVTKAPEMGAMMPASDTLISTGNAFLSEKVPGFRSMRASYRWIALCFLGLWGIFLGYIATKGNKDSISGKIIIVVLIVLFVPDVGRVIEKKTNYYRQFLEMKEDLVPGLKNDLSKGEIVAFLPWGNDFIVNYLAAETGVRAYNVGGDKNVDTAAIGWPQSLRELSKRNLNYYYAARVLKFMVSSEVDAVIIPYFDMLWAAHNWPYPLRNLEELRLVLHDLKGLGYVDVVERDYYSVVRLKNNFSSAEGRKELFAHVSMTYCLSPDCISKKKLDSATFSQTGVLKDGLLATTSKAGYLHFGPYLPLKGGDYVLNVYGSARLVKEAWADVVSQKGRVLHARFNIPPSGQADGSLLANQPVHIAESVEDVEIRVRVGAHDQLVLSGYELLPQIEKRP